MNRQTTRDQFLESTDEWICDSYSLGVHYLATAEQHRINIVDVSFSQHQVTLLSRDDIGLAFDQLLTPTSPDEMLDQAAARLAERRNSIS